MRKISSVVFLILVFNLPVSAQKVDSTALKFSESITAQELKELLYQLSDPALEGREMGTPGQKKAAIIISDFFKSAGFRPSIKQLNGDSSFFQVFDFSQPEKEKVKMQVGNYRPQYVKDFYYQEPHAALDIKTEEIVFVGYGIDSKKYSNFSDIDTSALRGKILVILPGEPRNSKGKYLASGKKQPSPQYQNYKAKAKALQKYRPAGIFLVDDGYSFAAAKNFPSTGIFDSAAAPEFHITQAFADSMLGGKLAEYKVLIDRKDPGHLRLKETPVSIWYKQTTLFRFSENVAGYLEGSDLKNELVIISAHYDHLGKNEKGIYPGANDNASGTSAVLEMAEAFMKAKMEGKGPRRSILFLLMSGEEKGLLGSEYYVEHPMFPLTNTIADLNVDMIGRTDTLHDAADYIYVIGADRISTELNLINEQVNNTYTKLLLDYKYNTTEDPNRFYYRSDHYNFAKNGIPVIFYFNGVHADYHKPGDTPEKVDPEAMLRVTRLIFFTAWELANLNHRLKVDTN